ncbi:hypothetical protein QBC38DRAFT_492768 [Podospora fimiseda]|uniref:C2H2-type domain-containing protein n=1 Tax=Podospora fimiseda TaxID=252190 RepID=A0AAN7BER5_9PEZI|nr:hypothetical protein QBC38DRAFT_492768 [Podospora fimiseda]
MSENPHFPRQGSSFRGHHLEFNTNLTFQSSPDIRRYLACPFFKLAPKQYPHCGTTRLRHNSDVRFHCKARCHSKELVFCPICNITFSGRSKRIELDEHIVRATCQPNNQPPMQVPEDLDLNGESQFGGATSKERTWYFIWETLFPGSPRPSSIYLDTSADAENRVSTGSENVSREIEAFMASSGPREAKEQVFGDYILASEEELDYFAHQILVRFKDHLQRAHQNGRI